MLPTWRLSNPPRCQIPGTFPDVIGDVVVLHFLSSASVPGASRQTERGPHCRSYCAITTMQISLTSFSSIFAGMTHTDSHRVGRWWRGYLCTLTGEGLGFKPTQPLSGWNLHVLQSAWVLSAFSGFLPQSTNMQDVFIGASKCPVGVRVSE